MMESRSPLTVQLMTSRAVPGRKSCRASIFALALACASLPIVAAPAANWPESGPLYLSLVSHHGKAEISVSDACAPVAAFHRDWGSASIRKADAGDHGVCVRIAPGADAVRVTHMGGACEIRPGLAASQPTSALTLTPSSPMAQIDGCRVGEAGAAAAASYGGIIIEFADGYTWSSSYHGAMPDLVQDSAPGTTMTGAAPGHSFRYRVDLHLPTGAPMATEEAAIPSAGPVQLVERQIDAPKTAIALSPAVAVPSVQPATEEPKPEAKPAQSAWPTTEGLKLRAQISKWIDQANAAGCGAVDNPCFRIADRRPTDPAEPWRVGISTSFPGDLLAALTQLRDGFWQDPRPDIEVTRNNVIILHRLGAQ